VESLSLVQGFARVLEYDISGRMEGKKTSPTPAVDKEFTSVNEPRMKTTEVGADTVRLGRLVSGLRTGTAMLNFTCVRLKKVVELCDPKSHDKEPVPTLDSNTR